VAIANSADALASMLKIGGEGRGMTVRFTDLGVNRSGSAWEMQLPKLSRGEPVYRFPVLVQPVYDGVPVMWTGERLCNGVGLALANRSEAETERELFVKLHGVQLDGELTRYAHGLVFVVHDIPSAEDVVDRWRHIEQVLPEDGVLVVRSLCVQAQRANFAKVAAEMFALGFGGITVYLPGYKYVEGRSEGVVRITLRDWERME